MKDGELLPDPFLDVTQVIEPGVTFDPLPRERGLLGVAFDPNFAVNSFVYIYYSVCKAPGPLPCTSASRTASRASPLAIRETQTSPIRRATSCCSTTSPPPRAATMAAGSASVPWMASCTSRSATGRTRPRRRISDRSTARSCGSTATEPHPRTIRSSHLLARCPEIYALGFRNPWRCRFHTSDGSLFCGDVGESIAEEVDVVEAGGNYGWPVAEGDSSNPAFVEAITTYGHDHPGGNAITGGDFGSETNFPGDYQQSYFFGDYLAGFIRRVVLAETTVSPSPSQRPTSRPTCRTIRISSSGPTARSTTRASAPATVHRIATTSLDQPPLAHATATPSEGPAPLDVQFSSAGSLHVPERTTIWLDTAVPLVDRRRRFQLGRAGGEVHLRRRRHVTGIRFYKSAANIGPHVGNLWDSTGTLLATATFTDESDSGWQQVTFSTAGADPAEHRLRGVVLRAERTLQRDPRLLRGPGLRRTAAARADGRRCGRRTACSLGPSSAFPTETYRLLQLLRRRRSSRSTAIRWT